jgi:hypothetical protein
VGIAGAALDGRGGGKRDGTLGALGGGGGGAGALGRDRSDRPGGAGGTGGAVAGAGGFGAAPPLPGIDGGLANEGGLADAAPCLSERHYISYVRTNLSFLLA